jgi:hypothetical protein
MRKVPAGLRVVGLSGAELGTRDRGRPAPLPLPLPLPLATA